jgi:hypothetical protein
MSSGESSLIPKFDRWLDSGGSIDSRKYEFGEQDYLYLGRCQRTLRS